MFLAAHEHVSSANVDVLGVKGGEGRVLVHLVMHTLELQPRTAFELVLGINCRLVGRSHLGLHRGHRLRTLRVH